MTEKKHYYVSVDKQDITDVPIPDHGIEYEIVANASEVEELQQLFMSAAKHEKNAAKFIALRPFDEWGADAEREGYSDNIIKVYETLYKLGTVETKDKISQLGILS